MKRSIASRVVLTSALLLASSAIALAQRTGYSRDEFVRRRAALMDRVKTGAVILFGDVEVPAGTHFRQDNDFFYFTGNEDLAAVIVMIPETKQSFLFLPEQSAREVMVDGPNLLKNPDARAKTGFSEIYPVAYLDEFLARRLDGFDGRLHLRLSPRDTMDEARSETALMDARKARSHYNGRISLDQDRIQQLKARNPHCEFRDVTPVVDARGLQGDFGHGVGLSVHDVDLGGVLKEGMVFAIKPALYYPEKALGIRIEDTVLITRNGCEILTRDVPKEIEDIEKLLAGRERIPRSDQQK